MTYFNNINNLDELKAAYRRLAMKNHPDHGGSVEIMQQINAEHDALFETLKKKHNASADEYHQTTETPEEFREIILTYTLSLSLVRRCCYDNRKFYYVRIDRTYSNGAVERVLCEEYKGADRHKAIKRFKDLQKAHPHQCHHGHKKALLGKVSKRCLPFAHIHPPLAAHRLRLPSPVPALSQLYPACQTKSSYQKKTAAF